MAKRICIVLPSHWSVASGGAEMQARMLVENLTAKKSLDIHYLTRKAEPAEPPQGYQLHRVPTRGTPAGSFALEIPGLLRILERLQPDVIYQRVGCAFTGACARFARQHGRRMIWHVSSDRDLMTTPWHAWLRAPLKRINKGLIEYGARHAGTVVVQNAQQADLLRQNFGRNDAVRIPNFHPEPAEPLRKSDERLTICWIGNIKPLKQLEVFLRLATDFKDRPALEFVVVGAAQLADASWRRLLAQIHGLANLRYTGPQPQSEVDSLLARSHVLVNTSTVEGFPNTFIQAWLRQVPVISLGVNPDGVFDGNRYGMCANGSYQRLRDALDALVSDAALRTGMGERAAAFARDTFSTRNIDRLIATLTAQQP